MNKTILIMLILAAGIVASGCVPSDIPPEKYCTKNSDCVRVSRSCCSRCELDYAINKKYAGQLSDEMKKQCENPECPETMSNFWDCQQEAMCINNTCTLYDWDVGSLVKINRREIETKLTISQELYLLVKNKETSPYCFRKRFVCEGIMQNKEIQPVQGICANTDVGSPDNPKGGWFQTFYDVRIEQGEEDVYPMSILVQNATPGNYKIKLIVEKGNHTCEETSTFTPYTSKDFIMLIKK